MVRCQICGRPAGDDPEARAKEQAASREGKKVVWICPLCAGRARYEAEEAGHGLKGKDRPPL